MKKLFKSLKIGGKIGLGVILIIEAVESIEKYRAELGSKNVK